MTIATVGHSNHSLDDFVALLRDHEVTRLVDVRRWPSSRRHPHFDGAALERALIEAGIDYVWLGDELGGYRRWEEIGTDDEGLDAGLTTPGFRAYAAYLRTPAGQAGLEALTAAAADGLAAVMCAERDPERCHRHYIADRLVAGGHQVLHILGPGSARRHALSEGAEVRDGAVFYPGDPRLPGMG